MKNLFIALSLFSAAFAQAEVNQTQTLVAGTTAIDLAYVLGRMPVQNGFQEYAHDLQVRVRDSRIAPGSRVVVRMENTIHSSVTSETRTWAWASVQVAANQPGVAILTFPVGMGFNDLLWSYGQYHSIPGGPIETSQQTFYVELNEIPLAKAITFMGISSP